MAMIELKGVPERPQSCSYEDCEEPPVGLACGRNRWSGSGPEHPGVAWYCEHHSNMVADEAHPEYDVYCPACGCNFGVN